MRALQVFFCDIRYQFKYGFYFLYAIIAAAYIAFLYLVPPALQRPAAAFIILTDPATLGFFFVGAMVLLERDEGLHSYYTITPATVTEYVLGKAFSLALVSATAGTVIAAAVFGRQVNFLLLLTGLAVGTPVFTLSGLAVGTASRSVNQYFVFSIPVGVLLIAPTFAIFADVYHPAIEILPATQLLRVIQGALGMLLPHSLLLSLTGLFFWSLLAVWLTGRTFSRYLQKGGN